MEFDRAYRWMKSLTVFFFSMALAGEILDWWNDFGEVALIIMTIAGVVTGGVTVLMGATRGQVRAVAADVRAVSADVRGVSEEVRGVSADVREATTEMRGARGQLGAIGQRLETQTDVLVQIRDRL